MGATEGNLVERRYFPRYRCHLFIFCRIKEAKYTIEAVTSNISKWGVMFESDTFIRPKSELKVEIYSPIFGFKNAVVSLLRTAKVIWIKRIYYPDNFIYEGVNRYKIGVKFTQPLFQKEQAIKDCFIKSL